MEATTEHICIGGNETDCDTAGYRNDRYDELSNEMKRMLIHGGGNGTS